ncbi:MAG: hypothetical protein LAT84_08950 [Balneolia bacterium]|nr:hypothetical protein [Balneolia bacterium]
MPDQIITLTVLPKPEVRTQVGQSLRVSVHFGMKLFSHNRLGPYDGFTGSTNWARRVREASVTFLLNGAEVQGNLASDTQPDPELWNSIFNENTPVNPYEREDYSNRFIRTFPAVELYESLRETYQAAAIHSPDRFIDTSGMVPGPSNVQATHFVPPELPPDQEAFLRLLQEAGPLADKAVIGKAMSELDIRKDGAFITPSEILDIANRYNVPEETVKWMQLLRFYNRPHAAESIAGPNSVEVDFHYMMGVLGDYPVLMRKLGIVADYEIELNDSLPSTGTIQALNIGGIPGRTDKPVSTYRVHSDSGIITLDTRSENTAELRAGCLDIGGGKSYQILQEDTDRMLMKAMNVASNTTIKLGALVARRARRGDFEPSEPESLPALQTSGITLYRKNQDAFLHQSFQMARAFFIGTEANALQSEKFYFEDLMDGFAVDIQDVNSGRWFSLCKRTGRYKIGEHGEEFIAEDEGSVAESSVSENDEGLENDFYIHEALFAWDGWSLVAEKPGNTIVPREVHGDIESNSSLELQADDNYERLGRIQHRPPEEFPLETWFKPQKGSLPPLRFGRKYRLRVRAVDIAGNRLSMDDADRAGSAVVSDEILYRRFEPVSPPVVLPRFRMGEGESVETVVIRSTYDLSTTEYLESEAVKKATAGLPHKWHHWNERHIAPPKAAQEMAERHSLFDTAITGNNDRLKQFNIAVKEKGTFKDKLIIDVNTGEPSIPVEGLGLVKPGESGVQPFDGLGPGEPLEEDHYLVYDTKKLQLPYLPDPFSGELALLGLPGAGDSVTKVSFGLSFPDAKPFRIVIVEGSGSPEFRNNDPEFGPRILRVPLPKAAIAEVDLSAALSNAQIDHMGVWGWIDGAGLNSSTKNRLRQLIREGRHWMISPSRKIKLVHAVQQPLEEPRLRSASAQKTGIGETAAMLSGRFHFDCRSTGRISFSASWEEPHDNPTLEQPEDGREGREIIAKSGRVLEMDIEPFYKDITDLRFPVPAEEHPDYPHKKQLDTTEVNHFFRHDFGDTKHRIVLYSLTAVSRFEHYFTDQLRQNENAFTRTGASYSVSILSSARPDAPLVKYLIPTFGWEQETFPEGNISRRKGGGLRVWLDRPWYSSGEGELLGVVIPGNHDAAMLPENAHLISHCGQDPIRKSAQPAYRLRPEHFPDRVRGNNTITLEETGLTAAVAGHQVHFDEERKLWYSDIQIDTGDAYFPMVRLALVRFQPSSMEDAHVSAVVLADFIQPAADRTAAVSLIGNQIRVMVSGVYSMNLFALEAGGHVVDKYDSPVDRSHRFVATLEQRRSGSDENWQTVHDDFIDLPLEAVQQYGPDILWMSTFDAGQEAVVESGYFGREELEFRVSVKEYEMHYRDPDEQARIPTRRIDPLAERVVYADTINVPKN